MPSVALRFAAAAAPTAATPASPTAWQWTPGAASLPPIVARVSGVPVVTVSPGPLESANSVAMSDRGLVQRKGVAAGIPLGPPHPWQPLRRRTQEHTRRPRSRRTHVLRRHAHLHVEASTELLNHDQNYWTNCFLAHDRLQSYLWSNFYQIVQRLIRSISHGQKSRQRVRAAKSSFSAARTGRKEAQKSQPPRILRHVCIAHVMETRWSQPPRILRHVRIGHVMETNGIPHALRRALRTTLRS